MDNRRKDLRAVYKSILDLQNTGVDAVMRRISLRSRKKFRLKPVKLAKEEIYGEESS
jgi:hypothetical protein